MFSFLYNDRSNSLGSNRIEIVHPKIEDLPKSARGYTANNVYPGFPPIMADGRALIGAWQPESYENDALLKDTGIQSNWEYRQYLTKNAETVARRNFVESANDVGFYERGAIEPKGEFAPMQAPTSLSEFSTPAFYGNMQTPQQAYGFFPSDLKANYLSREQLASQRSTQGIAITQDELHRLTRGAHSN